MERAIETTLAETGAGPGPAGANVLVAAARGADRAVGHHSLWHSRAAQIATREHADDATFAREDGEAAGSSSVHERRGLADGSILPEADEEILGDDGELAAHDALDARHEVAPRSTRSSTKSVVSSGRALEPGTVAAQSRVSAAAPPPDAFAR
jgi:hypothetical protein